MAAITFLFIVSSVLLYGAFDQVGANRTDRIKISSLASPQSPPAVKSMSFEVLQYNVFGRPYVVSSDGQSERLQHIPKSLHEISDTIDVVTFAEADVSEQRRNMLTNFVDYGFKYSTTILHDPDPFTSLLNGGVMVVSKWPILQEKQHVFRKACSSADCLAAKGVKYARLLKTVNGTSKIFNVFATHMQAWSTPEGQSDRIKQAQQMRQFIDSIGIPSHEPLILSGDFNVDYQNFQDEVMHLVDLLGSQMPLRVGELMFTSDPHTNLLVGRDGAADSNGCFKQYVKNWGPLKDNVYHPSLLNRTTCEMPRARNESVDPSLLCYCPCCPFEWLDYVLYGKAPYQQPSTIPTLKAHAIQVEPLTVDWTAPHSKEKMALIDLSDHYPVHGKFEFPVTRGAGNDDDPMTYHLDGCSTDTDCRFRSFRCYCNGPNCFFNGKQTDGWQLDSEHPVNRNCLYQKSSFHCLCGPT